MIETWWVSNKECRNCGAQMNTNGKVWACPECESTVEL